MDMLVLAFSIKHVPMSSIKGIKLTFFSMISYKTEYIILLNNYFISGFLKTLHVYFYGAHKKNTMKLI